jgi:putative transposase
MLHHMKYAPQEMRTYSLTAVTAGRRNLFQVETAAQLMVETIQAYRLKGNFELYAFAVMADHIHLLLTPAPEVAVEKVMQLVKGGFSFRLKSKMDVWERGYYDRRILDREGFDACKVYIEDNPARAHLPVTAVAYTCNSRLKSEMVDPRPAWFSGQAQG